MSQFESERDEELYYINIIAEILDGVLEGSDEQAASSDIFSAHKVPDIPLRTYLQRIKHKVQCCNDTLIMALIYIDRYTQADTDFRLCAHSIHRLLLVSILTAAKIHEDFYYDNHAFANAGGVPAKHINELEIHFLKVLGFRAFIFSDEFNEYKQKIFEAFQ